MIQDYISVKEASEKYRLSDSHIRRLLISGVLQGRKFGNAWAVQVTSLDRYCFQMQALGKKKHGLREKISKKP
jgi:excisionase family DNA binding protein